MALGLETIGREERTVFVKPLVAPGVEYCVSPDNPLQIRPLGPIGEGHMADIDLARPVHPLVDSIKVRFHEIARLIATGVSDVEVCRRLDITLEQLETLTVVPSFKLVLAKHVESRDAAFLNLKKQINMVAEEALAATHELVRTKQLPAKELVRVTIELLNMDGYGAVQKHLVAYASNDAVAKAKQAAVAANADRVLQGLPGDSPPGHGGGHGKPVAKIAA